LVDGRADSGQDDPRWLWNEELRDAFRLTMQDLQLMRPQERVSAKAG
jgi:hypothetical protein